MESSCSLSVVILTMNRKAQLLEALDSCMASALPEDAEFVIVDNHSTDGTEEALWTYMEEHSQYVFRYEYQEKNLGAGGGRIRGFDLARGKYLYFLDDDAFIARECADRFFLSAISYLEKNEKVASITTRIKDRMLKKDRDVDEAELAVDGRRVIYKYLGGSQFLRKDAFTSPLCVIPGYGAEELAPSILAQDKGYCHVYFDDIHVIHNPMIDKWQDSPQHRGMMDALGIGNTYATKVILYPVLFRPLLYLGYRRRCRIHLAKYDGMVKKCGEIARDAIKSHRRKKIKASTVIRMYRKFGLTVF